MAPTPSWRVLLTGATGFIGRALFPALVEAGYAVRCGSRRPEAAARRMPDRCWVELDVDRPETLPLALEGCGAAIYLVHGLAGVGDFEARELQAARAFAAAAGRAGVRRIVYLGGVEPRGAPSKHLRSRLAVGEALRKGPVPVVELRAAMIIGPDSASWQMTRDLVARLPVVVLPRGMGGRFQPVAERDAVAALRAALELAEEAVGVHGVPGPETLTAREALERTAALLGTRPVIREVPLLTAGAAARGLSGLTRADGRVARALALGLRHDLLVAGRGIFALMPGHRRLGFDEAARLALGADDGRLSRAARVLERTVQELARRSLR